MRKKLELTLKTILRSKQPPMQLMKGIDSLIKKSDMHVNKKLKAVAGNKISLDRSITICKTPTNYMYSNDFINCTTTGMLATNYVRKDAERGIKLFSNEKLKKVNDNSNGKPQLNRSLIVMSNTQNSNINKRHVLYSKYIPNEDLKKISYNIF